METRKCKVCGVEKPLSEFPSLVRAGREYHRWACRDCYNKAYQGKRARSNHISINYGLNDAQLEAMLERQGGACAICNQPETAKLNGKVKPLSVDHDHVTHKNRGLLCNSCNVGLSRFKDNPKLLQKAIDYLERTK